MSNQMDNGDRSLMGYFFGLLASWLTWVMGHLVEINQFLQFIVLCLGIVTGVLAIRRASK
jgi:hypothetical protein